MLKFLYFGKQILENIKLSTINFTSMKSSTSVYSIYIYTYITIISKKITFHNNSDILGVCDKTHTILTI